MLGRLATGAGIAVLAAAALENPFPLSEQTTVDGTHDWPGRQGELGRRRAAKFLDRYLG